MPQKTIYLSEADAALWDEIKARIGEKSMSTLFVEYLRKTLDARDGFLHVVRAERGGPLRQAPFAVMFAPLDAPGGFMQPHYCQGLADLTQFLQQLGLAKGASETIQSALKSQESVSERLTLTQDKIALF
jgi:hypothetical protein